MNKNKTQVTSQMKLGICFPVMDNHVIPGSFRFSCAVRHHHHPSAKPFHLIELKLYHPAALYPPVSRSTILLSVSELGCPKNLT